MPLVVIWLAGEYVYSPYITGTRYYIVNQSVVHTADDRRYRGGPLKAHIVQKLLRNKIGLNSNAN